MYRYVQNRVVACVKLLLMLTDFLCLNLIFILAHYYFSYTNSFPVSSQGDIQFTGMWTSLNLIAALTTLITGLYRDETFERLESVFRKSFWSLLFVILGFVICCNLSYQVDGIPSFLVVLNTSFIFYIIISRFALSYVYTVMPKRFGWAKKVAVIANNNYLSAISNHLLQRNAFYDINTIQYIDGDEAFSKREKIDQFRRYFEEVSKLGIYDVFVVNSPDISPFNQELIIEAGNQCVQINFVQTGVASIPFRGRDADAFQIPLPVLHSNANSLSLMENRIKKRIGDLVISLLVIVFVLSWLVPIIGIIIKFQSAGPIFFKQERSGKNNKTFFCLKFRSMVMNYDSNKTQATKDDRRITPIGKFLRKTNLDEFPQFINVFLGQMSVVGPRPHMLAHTEHYSKLIQHYMVRQMVKPGITGWAQVNGYRGETKEPELMAKRVEYDLEYMNNWSAMLDLKIICMTGLNMVRGEKNAY